MAIKKYNPTSPGKRFRTVMDYAEVTSDRPLTSLVRIAEEDRWKK